MLSKLTLTIEKDIIEQAKVYAHDKNKSVSRIVEEYLRNVSAGIRKGNSIIESPITDSLIGMFVDSGKDYKILLEEALSEKFL